MKKKISFILFALFGLFLFIPDSYALTEIGYITPSNMTLCSPSQCAGGIDLQENVSLPYLYVSADWTGANLPITTGYSYVVQIRTSFKWATNLSGANFRFTVDGVSCATTKIVLNDLYNSWYYTNVYFNCPVSTSNSSITQMMIRNGSNYVTEATSGTGQVRYWWFRYDPVTEDEQNIQEVLNSLSGINKEISETNELLENDDTSEATDEAGDFFNGFETDTFGLTSIITAPLNLISSIVGSTCSPVPISVPYTNKTLNLPCLSTIYRNHFGALLDIYQIITFGIVSYWVCVQTFNLVKDFKNPDHDEIEVLDL